jgi:hypothetical protein
MNKKRFALCYIGRQTTEREASGYGYWNKFHGCIIFDDKEEAIKVKTILLEDKNFKDIFLTEEIT